jgi:3-dehydroquinate dehydratase II
MKCLVINGPNLNLLGIREPSIYGYSNYQDLVEYIRNIGHVLNMEIEIFQSNHEGALIDKIQSAYKTYDGIIINPAAYTHTSIALMDALKAVNLPSIEVHLSDISQREAFRKTSYVSLACLKTFSGEGFLSYQKALEHLYVYLKKEGSNS